MKRIIAVLLVVTTVLSMMISFTGCSSDNNAISMGEWLTYVADYFGMEDYSSDKPYFTKVDKENDYFGAFQKAAEWEILAPNNDVSSTDTVTWKQALITLVNAGGFLGDGVSDEMKIEFAIEKFDKSIRLYWMKRNINAEDAIMVLAKAQNIWANKKYTENIERYQYNDNVVDLSKDDVNYTQKGNIIALDENSNVKVGDICVVPDEDNPLEKTFRKVKSVNKKGSKVEVNTTDDVAIQDVYEELYIKETLVPTSENTVIYDGNGNRIFGSVPVAKQSNISEAKAEHLMYTDDQAGNIDGCATGSFEQTFTKDNIKVKIGGSIGDSTSLSASISCDKLFGVDGLSLDESFEINSISATTDVDWGFLKLKSASLRINYKTTQKLGLEYTNSGKWLAVPGTEQENGAWRYSNGNGKFLTNVKKALNSPLKKDSPNGCKTIGSKKKIKICSLNIYSAGVAKVCLDVNVEIKFDGSLSVSVTESGSKGVEYKNGNIRFIKSSTKSVDAELKAKLEATVGVGPSLYAVGLKKQLVGLEVRFGAGASATCKAHLADSQMHLIEDINFGQGAEAAESAGDLQIATTGADMQAVAELHGGIYDAQADAEVKLHIDWCVDVNIYAIVRIGLSDNAYLADLIGGKAKLSVDIFNEKNATLFNIHIDNWSKTPIFTAGKSGTCTLNYVPFDKATDEEIDEEAINDRNDSIAVGENMALSTMNATMQIGQNYLVDVIRLPKGYSIDDVIFSSKDKRVATVDGNGTIKAVGEGCTIVYAETKDGKYKSMISVIVETAEKVKYEGIKSKA